AISRVARWNGSAWSGFGTNAPDWVGSVQEFHNQLYVGVQQVAGDPEGIRRWDGTSWLSAGGGLSGGEADALCAFGDSLVVAGVFSQAGGAPAHNVAFWDGSAWHAAGAGLDGGFVSSVVVWNGRLIAGGTFTFSGSQTLHGAAIWDGFTW